MLFSYLWLGVWMDAIFKNQCSFAHCMACGTLGQMCESACLLLSPPHDLSLCVPSPWECHGSVLYFETLQNVPFVFFFFLVTHKIVPGPPTINDTPDWSSVHKCNTIWLNPAFVPLVQMTKQNTHYTADLLLPDTRLQEPRGKKQVNLFRVMVAFSWCFPNKTILTVQ